MSLPVSVSLSNASCASVKAPSAKRYCVDWTLSSGFKIYIVLPVLRAVVSTAARSQNDTTELPAVALMYVMGLLGTTLLKYPAPPTIENSSAFVRNSYDVI